MASIQQSLFETEPPAWDVDDAATALVATVVLPSGPAGEFGYLAPDEMVGGAKPERALEAGRRVRVPLGRGNRSVVGYCVDVSTKPAGARKLKAVSAVLDRGPLLSSLERAKEVAPTMGELGAREHREVVGAIRERDPDRVVEIMGRHLRRTAGLLADAPADGEA